MSASWAPADGTNAAFKNCGATAGPAGSSVAEVSQYRRALTRPCRRLVVAVTSPICCGCVRQNVAQSGVRCGAKACRLSGEHRPRRVGYRCADTAPGRPVLFRSYLLMMRRSFSIPPSPRCIHLLRSFFRLGRCQTPGRPVLARPPIANKSATRLTL